MSNDINETIANTIASQALVERKALKEIICQNCGGHDLVKKGKDEYVCVNCGTGYTANDVLKIILSGNVSVGGDINNLLILAKRAYGNQEYVDAFEYYERALELNANNWQAIMGADISELFVYRDALDVRNMFDKDKLRRNLPLVFDAIQSEGYTYESERVYVAEVAQMYTEALTNRANRWVSSIIGWRIIRGCALVLYALGDILYERYRDDEVLRGWCVYAWETGILQHDSAISFCTQLINKREELEIIDQYVRNVKYYKPDFTYTPSFSIIEKRPDAQPKQGTGCKVQFEGCLGCLTWVVIIWFIMYLIT